MNNNLIITAPKEEQAEAKPISDGESQTENETKVLRTKCSHCVPDNDENSIEQPKKVANKFRNNGLLVLCVYGSALFVYFEFIALMVALNVTYAPPGLIFLLTSLGYIGFIVYKVSDCNCKFVIHSKRKIKILNLL